MTWRTIVLGILVSSGIAGCERRGEAERFEGTPQVIDDSVLLFPGGASHATNLRSVRHHAVLSAGADRVPFIVLSGVPSEGTEADRVVVVVRADRPAETTSASAVLPYPGSRIAAAASDSLRDVRLFVGECVPGGFGGVVQVTASAGTADTAATIVAHQITGDSLALVTREAAPSLADILATVETGACREIPRQEEATAGQSVP